MQTTKALQTFYLTAVLFFPFTLLAQTIIGTYGSYGLISEKGDTILEPVWRSIKPIGNHFKVSKAGDLHGVYSNAAKWIVTLDTGDILLKGNDAYPYYWRSKSNGFGYLYKADGGLLLPDKVKFFRVSTHTRFPDAQLTQSNFFTLQTEDLHKALYRANGELLIPPRPGGFIYLGEKYPIYAVETERYSQDILIKYSPNGYNKPKYYSIYDHNFQRIPIPKPISDVYFTHDPNLVFVKTDTSNVAYQLLDVTTHILTPTPYYTLRPWSYDYTYATDGQKLACLLNEKFEPSPNEWFSSLQGISRTDSTKLSTIKSSSVPLAYTYTEASKEKTIIYKDGTRLQLPPEPRIKKEIPESDTVTFLLVAIRPDSTLQNTDWTRLRLAEVAADFPGGRSQFAQLLQNEFKCNERSYITVDFIIEPDGSMTNFKIVRPDPNNSLLGDKVAETLKKLAMKEHPCSAELESLFKQLPKWTPGTIKGVPVPAMYGLMIKPKYKRNKE
jgi:hypothetical protein